MGFKEFTISDGENEVMICVDANTGKILDLYTWADNTLESYSESRDSWLPMTTRWKVGKNPLFVQCSPTTRKLYLQEILLDSVFILDYEDEYYNADIAILTNMMTFYKFDYKYYSSFVGD